MLDFLSEKEHNARPLLMHGFSIGGYMYTDAVSFILEQPEKYGESVKFPPASYGATFTEVGLRSLKYMLLSR